MPLDPETLAGFRAQLADRLSRDRAEWHESRHLVAPGHFRRTLDRLIAAIETSSYAQPLRMALGEALRAGTTARVQDLPGAPLKQLTGLPPSKAIRALCLLFGLIRRPDVPETTWSPEQIEAYVREHPNPFDLLLQTDVASVLELGAGDLSFAAALVKQYLPPLESRGRELTVHCQDRLRPGSRVGGQFHADPQRLEPLIRHASRHLQFRFWGGQDMFELDAVRGIWPRYTIVTCQAPPNPAVAFEPSRVSYALIQEHLRKTKGDFQVVREEGEEVLEVRHAGRTLLFPPWKFDVRGPSAFLDLLSGRGRLSILSAVDTEVFWELLAQLLADPSVRPPDEFFTPPVIARVFGEVGEALQALPIGGSVILSDHAALRSEAGKRSRFRYAEVRRGALFPGVPASHTATLFPRMTEEPPPWFIVLVPEEVPAS
jgi:hypothetical protein